ncbi:MAG: hypothetical protein R3B84_23410 [Zavarzinella sp.]
MTWRDTATRLNFLALRLPMQVTLIVFLLCSTKLAFCQAKIVTADSKFKEWQENVALSKLFPSKEAEVTKTLSAHPEWVPLLRKLIYESNNHEIRSIYKNHFHHYNTNRKDTLIKLKDQWRREKRIDFFIELADITSNNDVHQTIDSSTNEICLSLITQLQNYYNVNQQKKIFIKQLSYLNSAKTLNQLTKQKSVIGDSLDDSRLSDTYFHTLGSKLPDSRLIIDSKILSTKSLVEVADAGPNNPCSHLVQSVLLSNSDMALHEVKNSLLILDGDALITFNTSALAVGAKFGHAFSGVVIANGNFTCNVGIAGTSLIFCSGECNLSSQVFPFIDHNAFCIYSGKQTTGPDSEKLNKNFIHQNSKVPSQLVKFFSLDEVGLKVTDKEGKVVITELAKDSFMAKSFRTGDKIRTMNGFSISSEADLRRQMRSTVVWDAGILEVERQGTTQTYYVQPGFFIDKPKK